MRAVNLVPAERRHAAAGDTGGLPPEQLGLVILLFLLVATAGGWAVLRHQAGTARTDAAIAAQRSATARAQAAVLAPAVALATERTKREQQVASLAAGRTDWARVYGRMAAVVPAGVRLSEVTGSSTGSADDGAAVATPAPAAGAGSTPTVAVTACAASQRLVARTVDGLRTMADASSVSLASSTRSGSAQGDSGSGACAGITMVASVVLVAPEGAAAGTATAAPTGDGAATAPSGDAGAAALGSSSSTGGAAATQGAAPTSTAGAAQ